MTFKLVNGVWVQSGQLNPPNPYLQPVLPVPPLDLDGLYAQYNKDVAQWRTDNSKGANVMPPDSWIKPRQALLQGQIEAQTAARQEIVDSGACGEHRLVPRVAKQAQRGTAPARTRHIVVIILLLGHNHLLLRLRHRGKKGCV